MPGWDSSSCSSFLPQANNMLIRSTVYYKLRSDVNVSLNFCLSVLALLTKLWELHPPSTIWFMFLCCSVYTDKTQYCQQKKKEKLVYQQKVFCYGLYLKYLTTIQYEIWRVTYCLVDLIDVNRLVYRNVCPIYKLVPFFIFLKLRKLHILQQGVN